MLKSDKQWEHYFLYNVAIKWHFEVTHFLNLMYFLLMGRAAFLTLLLVLLVTAAKTFNRLA